VRHSRNVERDFVWIMARKPSIPDEDFLKLARLIREQGYDTGRLMLVPQQRDVEAASLTRP
jgi:lipocalin